MHSIILPIYYTQTFKTKDDNTFLVGMNWYRNCKVYYLLNQVKQHYHSLVATQLPTPITAQFTLNIKVFYKNPSCDGSNIASIMEKFTLDALQNHSIITNDNIKYHLGTTWSIGGCDKLNPRVEITLQEVL